MHCRRSRPSSSPRTRSSRTTSAALARAERDNASAYSQTPEPNLKLYFFMHSALLLWLRAHGSSYPRLRYMWRLEPDVLFAGPLSHLVRASESRAHWPMHAQNAFSPSFQ